MAEPAGAGTSSTLRHQRGRGRPRADAQYLLARSTPAGQRTHGPQDFQTPKPQGQTRDLRRVLGLGPKHQRCEAGGSTQPRRHSEGRGRPGSLPAGPGRRSRQRRWERRAEASLSSAVPESKGPAPGPGDPPRGATAKGENARGHPAAPWPCGGTSDTLPAWVPACPTPRTCSRAG